MTKADKQAKKEFEDLQKVFSLKFTKQELIGIFNVLLSREYKLGDGALLYPVVKRIESIIAVATNIPQPPEQPEEKEVPVLDLGGKVHES